MKTSHFSENFDLCHPQPGSEHSNSNLATNSNISSDIASRNDYTAPSATVNYSTSSATYGSSSSDQQQASKYERSANELLRNQQRQQQQQEQNKKRKRETGE